MIIHAGTIAAPASRILRIEQPFRLLSADAYPMVRVISGGEVEEGVTDRDAIVDRTTGAVAVTDYQVAVQYLGTPATPATYLSSDPAIATVDADGFVTHISPGSVKITATIGGQSAVVPLTMAETGGATVDVFVEYQPGTLGRHASDAVDTRIEGKSPATALKIFTEQNHTTGTYVRNPDCWASDIDLTAISPWNSTGGHRGGGILIAPNVLLCAAHYDYQFPLGSTVRFVAADGTVVERTIAARQRHPSYSGFPGYAHDITLCRLNSDVPASIAPVKLWPADWAEHLPALSAERNIPVLVTDQEEKALVTNLRAIDSGFYAGRVGLAAPTDPQRLAFYESKILHDSGNPICAIIDDELVLLAVLTSGGAGAGTNLSAEIDTLNSMMTALGSAYQVEEYNLSRFGLEPLQPNMIAKSDNMTPAFAVAAGAAPVETAQQIRVAYPSGAVRTIEAGTAAPLDSGSLAAATDYAIHALPGGALVCSANFTPPEGSVRIGGFHFAPGGNATGVAGGDSTPTVNPYSIWDLRWRPQCADPRGMALVAGRFWADIYLTNTTPDLLGTSAHGATIADGNSRPVIPAIFGGNGSSTYAAFDWFTAAETLAAFGKQLLTVEEYQLASFGVTEGTSIGSDPVTTQLDAPRTSKWGLMQATGNLTVWCQDAGWRQAADTVSAAPTSTELFGAAGGANVWGWHGITGGRGSHYMQHNQAITRARAGGFWSSGSNAGSRSVSWNIWASNSHSTYAARGRCDHLIS